MRRWVLWAGVAAGVVALTAYQFRQSALPCPSLGRVLSEDEILQGAQRFAVADLIQMHQLAAQSGDGIDLTALQAAQPDCCNVARDVAPEFVKLTEQAVVRLEAPPLAMFVNIVIDNPALLPEQFLSTAQVIGMDVCGDAIQDWVTVLQPLQG